MVAAGVTLAQEVVDALLAVIEIVARGDAGMEQPGAAEAAELIARRVGARADAVIEDQVGAGAAGFGIAAGFDAGVEDAIGDGDAVVIAVGRIGVAAIDAVLIERMGALLALVLGVPRVDAGVEEPAGLAAAAVLARRRVAGVEAITEERIDTVETGLLIVSLHETFVQQPLRLVPAARGTRRCGVTQRWAVLSGRRRSRNEWNENRGKDGG
jgi:hypothetical protein